MPLARKRHPVNDRGESRAQVLPCVILARPYWDVRKMVIAAGLAVVLIAVGAAGAWMFLQPAAVVGSNDAALSKTKQYAAKPPYDIVISELTEEEAVSVVETKTENPLENAQFKRVFEVSVEDDYASGEEQGSVNLAARQDDAARSYARSGDINQALSLAKRAVESEPANMSYVLSLAIIHDRAGDSANAGALYEKVLKAYDEGDDTLPSDTEAKRIRERMMYLANR